ncbi:MAG TPA: glycosyltransferase family 2 protein [Gallicola sp.]|nr:glycosyltransferase family 2 protein [Gallicola sp.]
MFSVVIPLYNKELSISNTIQSVLNQTFQDFEIVVVNDGSTDNSLQVVEKINDSRIRIINKPNGGVSSARNRGIKEAKYDWIAFLDGDDLWIDNHLETLKDMIETNPADKVFTTSFIFSDNNNVKVQRESFAYLRVDNFCKASLNHFNKTIISSITICIHKEVFGNIGVFNTNYIRGEDVDLWIRISKIYDIIYTDKVTAIYRKDAENRSDVSYVGVKRTFLKDIDFKNITDNYERKYYQYFLLNRFKGCILKRKWSELFYLLFKYNYHIFI